jgi:hypothetical protein
VNYAHREEKRGRSIDMGGPMDVLLSDVGSDPRLSGKIYHNPEVACPVDASPAFPFAPAQLLG